MDLRRPRGGRDTNPGRDDHFLANLSFIPEHISLGSPFHPPRTRRSKLARKTVLVCDKCGREVDAGKGATMRLSFSDARRGAKEADLCDSCATGLPGLATARRGRKPKSVAA